MHMNHTNGHGALFFYCQHQNEHSFLYTRGGRLKTARFVDVATVCPVTLLSSKAAAAAGTVSAAAVAASAAAASGASAASAASAAAEDSLQNSPCTNQSNNHPLHTESSASFAMYICFLY